MIAFVPLLIISILLCSLVAGFVLAFAVVVMPGIGALSDKDYLRAFKVMDRIIQNNSPLFMLVWMGAVAALLACAVTGWFTIEGIDRMLLIAAFLGYLLFVQLPTITINVPLNNSLQETDLESAKELQLQTLRQQFETRWVRWNTNRTIAATLVAIVLLTVLSRL